MSLLSHDITVSEELIYDFRSAITTLTKRVADLDREVLFLRGQLQAITRAGFPRHLQNPSAQLREAVANVREAPPARSATPHYIGWEGVTEW